MRARELVVLDLGAEVVRVEALVALEAFFAGEALVVEHGVDPHGVRVAPGAGPDDHDLAPQLLLAMASISSRVSAPGRALGTSMSAKSTA